MNDPVLEPHQIAAVEFLSTRRRALIKSPAGSGKTFIAAGALAKVLGMRLRKGKVRVGWIANTNEQCDQARAALAAFERVRTQTAWTVGCPAAFPGGIVCDVLIIDEAHHATAATWSAIIDRHQGALWLFTATPFGEDEERNAALRKMIDDQIFEVPRSAVSNRVVPAEVRLIEASDDPPALRAVIDEAIDDELKKLVPRFLYNNRPKMWERIAGEFCEKFDVSPATYDAARQTNSFMLNRFISDAARSELWPKVAFRHCIATGIEANKARNASILQKAKFHDRDSLIILVNTVSHGVLLSEKLPESVVCHSKMKKRKDSMERFRSGDLRCIIATSLADEGLDVPRANVLILAGGGRSAAKVEQRTGRVTRSHGDKQQAIIYDFTDPQHPLLASQARKRQAIYSQLGYLIIPVDGQTAELFSRVR